MIPRDMLCKHDPPRSQGDCWRACIASILELPTAHVPHFLDNCEVGDQEQARAAYRRFSDWLARRGLFYIEVHPNGDLLDQLEDYPLYTIATGPSPNFEGIDHSVVSWGITIAHDPAPSRAGLLGYPEDWKFGFFVRSVVT